MKNTPSCRGITDVYIPPDLGGQVIPISCYKWLRHLSKFLQDNTHPKKTPKLIPHLVTFSFYLFTPAYHHLNSQIGLRNYPGELSGGKFAGTRFTPGRISSNAWNYVTRWQHHLSGSVLLAGLLAVLDDEVSQHAEDEHQEKNDDLDIDTGDAAIAEGNDEADRLPQTVVGEGGLSLGAREQSTVEGWNTTITSNV